MIDCSLFLLSVSRRPVLGRMDGWRGKSMSQNYEKIIRRREKEIEALRTINESEMALQLARQKVELSYAENDNYYGTSVETTVTITERPDAPYTLKETPDAVTLAVGEDMKVDYIEERGTYIREED